MNVVITMAGLGQRFIDAGYKVPKYCIEAKGRTLFDWSMESLADFRDPSDVYFFILRKEDGRGDFIRSECARIGIPNPNVIELSHTTDGQATTALLAAKLWDRDDELMIYNIDTYVEAGQMTRDSVCGDGFIPCFKAAGNHWSFVSLDENGNAIEVKEKQRISDNCTLGAYYFKSAALYEQLYDEYYEKGMGDKSQSSAAERKERYVAPLYNYLIEKGGRVLISDIDPDKVHVLGTPDELNEFLKSE